MTHTEIKQPWEKTVQDYLGPAKVIDTSPDGMPGEIIAQAGERMCALAVRISSGEISPEKIFPPGFDRFDVYQHRGGYLVTSKETGSAIASYGLDVVPFVAPQWRGQGICAKLHVFRDTTRRQMTAGAYSENGFKARIRAHAMHVQAALTGGLKVPDEVRDQYRSTATGLKLVHDYSAQDHNKQLDEARRERMKETFNKTTEGYVCRHIDLDMVVNRIDDYFSPKYNAGAALAVRMAATIEADLRVTRINGSLIVQAQKGNFIHDILGVRTVGQAENDMIVRGIMEEGDPAPEVFVFQSLSEIHDTSLRNEIGEMVIEGQPECATKTEVVNKVLDSLEEFDRSVSALDVVAPLEELCENGLDMEF